MQPLYKEYIDYLNSHNIDTSWFRENRLWLDSRSMIKFFDKDGIQHKVCRILIDINPEYNPNKSDYTLSIKYYKDMNKVDVLSIDWKETVKLFDKELESKVARAKEIILEAWNNNKDYQFKVSTSTGKDSMVALDLVSKFAPSNSYEVVWCNTSLDCAETYKMVNVHKDWTKINPKEGFYQWIKRVNMIPSRFGRACCNIYKEQASLKAYKDTPKLIWIMGLRKDESNTRSSYQYIHKFPQWEKSYLDWTCYSPIIEWSDLDVWLYILKYKVELNEKYKKGYARVGCNIACPYYTKTTWSLDEYWYKKGYDRWHNILQYDLIEHKKWAVLNCTTREYHFKWSGGVLRNEPTDEVLEDFQKGTHLSLGLIKNYFNHTCKNCGELIKKPDVVSMNMKYFGRDVTDMYCKKCIKHQFDWKENDWREQIKSFKQQGCELF